MAFGAELFAAAGFAVDLAAVALAAGFLAAGLAVALVAGLAVALAGAASSLTPADLAMAWSLALRREAVLALIRSFFTALSYSD